MFAKAVLIAALPLLAPASQAAPPRHAAASAHAAPAQDWSRTARMLPSGAFVLGNPAAKVKIVEYLSLTCPHCAVVAGESMTPLTIGYIRTGLVSFEVRHALRDGFDLSATLLARCNGPAAFFPTLATVLATQQRWMERAAAFVEPAGFGAQPLPDRLLGVARASGLDALFRARGLPDARMRACLADTRQLAFVEGMTDEAWNRRRIPGTPAFLIDGVATPQMTGWASLEPLVKAALAARG